MTTRNEAIWDGAYKIPWNDPDFSRRMLAEHLSQDHELASRSEGWLGQQVAWIHEDLLRGRPARILDLGCGPGLYMNRLIPLGHCGRGIDFGPASIDYARAHAPEPSACDFVLGDIRDGGFGGPYDLVMILFGELNVFSPEEASRIVRYAQDSLAPGGRLIVELQSPAAVEQAGLSAPQEQRARAGLFSDQPYRCSTTNQWLADQQAAIQTFEVEVEGCSEKAMYRSTTKAWSDQAFCRLLTEAGLAIPSREANWPTHTDALSLWLAEKP